MTNDVGIRIYKETTASSSPLVFSASKDVSDLEITYPLRMTIRCRAHVNTNGSDDAQFGMSIEYGEYYQSCLINVQNNNQLDEFLAYINATTQSGLRGTLTSHGITALTNDDWFWMEIEITSDKEFKFKVKDDNTTTRPTSGWDEEFTHPDGIIDAVASETLQKVTVWMEHDNDSNNTFRSIFEIDEIYITQD